MKFLKTAMTIASLVTSLTLAAQDDRPPVDWHTERYGTTRIRYQIIDWTKDGNHVEQNVFTEEIDGTPIKSERLFNGVMLQEEYFTRNKELGIDSILVVDHTKYPPEEKEIIQYNRYIPESELGKILRPLLKKAYFVKNEDKEKHFPILNNLENKVYIPQQIVHVADNIKVLPLKNKETNETEVLIYHFMFEDGKETAIYDSKDDGFLGSQNNPDKDKTMDFKEREYSWDEFNNTDSLKPFLNSLDDFLEKSNLYK